MPKVAFSHFDNCFICFDISLGLISLLIFTDTVLYEGKTIWILCDHRTDRWGITLLQTYKKHSCHVFRTTLTQRATYSFLTFHLRHSIGWSGQVFYHVSMLCWHLLDISWRQRSSSSYAPAQELIWSARQSSNARATHTCHCILHSCTLSYVPMQCL